METPGDQPGITIHLFAICIQPEITQLKKKN